VPAASGEGRRGRAAAPRVRDDGRDLGPQARGDPPRRTRARSSSHPRWAAARAAGSSTSARMRYPTGG